MNERYEYRVTAAGRVNIIGEHVDYCGGKVFPAALSYVNAVFIRPNGTNRINIRWTTSPDTVSLEIDKLDRYRQLRLGNYQAGCAYIWKKRGHLIQGCDILSDCTVPFGSGLSSSAAIEVSTIAAFAALAGEPIDSVEVAIAAQRAEREYVGMNCGIMDQYASACGKKDMAMLLDCNTLNCSYIPFELGDYCMVIANTNKPHNLVESKYNERRAQTEQALQILRTQLNVTSLAEVKMADFIKYGYLLNGKIYDRARHVIEECERVNSAAVAMSGGNIEMLGMLLNKSHASLKDLYEVTGPELDALAFAAQNHPACVGSRMTGGGFGGCTVSLVRRDGVEDFKRQVALQYTRATGYIPTYYQPTVGDGITVTKL